MKYAQRMTVAAMAAMLATTSLAPLAAFATEPASVVATLTPYATQTELLKTADAALATLTHVQSARAALFENRIDVAKAEVVEARTSLTSGETDMRALRVADPQVDAGTKDYLPFDMSITLTDTFKATKENEAALQKARSLMQTGDRNAAIEVLRTAAVEMNISTAMLPEKASVESLTKAAQLLDSKSYFEANLALKSVTDSVIVRVFGIDAIPKQGDIE